MARISNVPANQVGEIVQSFVDEGKTEVTAEADDGENPSGTWTVSGQS